MKEPFIEPLDALADLMEQRVRSVSPQPKTADTSHSDGSGVPRTPEEWDTVFQESGTKHTFGREASTLARLALQYWKQLHGEERGLLLDLGCGEGRDAVYFAQAGFDVVAVDGSSVGLQKVDVLAREAHVGLTTVHCPLEVYRLPNHLPFLHAHNCLQFIGEACVPYLEGLQKRTPAGGMHSVSVFTRECVPEQEGIYRMDCKELKFMYRDWMVLFYAEEMLWREPIQRYLSFAQIIAVKQV